MTLPPFAHFALGVLAVASVTSQRAPGRLAFASRQTGNWEIYSPTSKDAHRGESPSAQAKIASPSGHPTASA